MIETINTVSNAWIEYLNVILFPNTIILFFLITALIFLKKISANLRYSLSLMGLFKLIFPSFIILPILKPNMDQTIRKIIISLQSQVSSNLLSTKMAESSLPFTSILFLCWLSMVLIILGRSLWRIFQYYKIIKKAKYIEQLNFKGKKIKLFKSEKIYTPLTFGFGLKSIYVPKLWETWSAECQNLILAHEFEHIRRRDGIVQMIQIIIQALYFFHPFVWILNKQINNLREMACDDASTKKEKKNSLLYSKCLVEIAEGMVNNATQKQPAIALLTSKKNFLKRVKYQLEENKMNNFFQKIFFISVIIFIFAVTSITFTQSQNKSDQDWINIFVKSEKEIIVNGKVTDLLNFEKLLNENINQRDPSGYVSLKVDKAVKMSIVNKIQSILRKGDLLRLKYSLATGGVDNITLPQKSDMVMLQKIPKKNLCNIWINSKGEILVDDEIMTREKMQAYVKKRFMENQNLIVDVTTSFGTRMQDYVNVLDDLKKIGITRISIDSQAPIPPPPRKK